MKSETAGTELGWRVKVDYYTWAANTNRNNSRQVVDLFVALEYFNDLQIVNLIAVKRAKFVVLVCGCFFGPRPNPRTKDC